MCQELLKMQRWIQSNALLWTSARRFTLIQLIFQELSIEPTEFILDVTNACAANTGKRWPFTRCCNLYLERWDSIAGSSSERYSLPFYPIEDSRRWRPVCPHCAPMFSGNRVRHSHSVMTCSHTSFSLDRKEISWYVEYSYLHCC